MLDSLYYLEKEMVNLKEKSHQMTKILEGERKTLKEKTKGVPKDFGTPLVTLSKKSQNS